MNLVLNQGPGDPESQGAGYKRGFYNTDSNGIIFFTRKLLILNPKVGVNGSRVY